MRASLDTDKRSCSKLTSPRRLCDTIDMSDTLTIRLPSAEKERWQKAAAAVKESVAEYVRKAVSQRTDGRVVSGWERHMGSVNIAVPPPTNANVRRAFSRRRSKG